MQLTSIAYNIANKVLDSEIKILYENSDSIFDKIFKELDYYIVDNDSSCYFYYDMKVVNNHLKYLNDFKEVNQKTQLSNMIFFHDFCPPELKKEDKIILNNTLRNTHKVVFTESHSNNWNLNPSTTSLIKYGLPKNKIENNNRTQDILILNLKNNQQLNNLFQHIQNSYPNTSIINSVASYSLEEIQKVFSQYKIVIDIDSAINNLFATTCGCITLNIQQFDRNIKSNLQIMDFRTINNLIKTILTNDNVTNAVESDNQYIQKEYSLERFKENFDSLIQKIKREPFII